MSQRIPIVTPYLKVKTKTNNNNPVLSKVNEAAYNASSPFTLLSEYQIREHGFIGDSVATKHKSSADTYGTQQLVLNKRIHMPFEVRGGIMGFEIEDDEIGEPHSRYDTFELNSCQKWIPARFRTSTTQVEGEKLPTNPAPYHVCLKNASVKEEYI